MIRGQLACYLKAVPGANAARSGINHSTDPETVANIIRGLYPGS